MALKLLKDADEARRRALVIAGAKTACQLHHPNIATIFEAGEADGTLFIAMQLVEGCTAASSRAQQPEWLMRVARQACGALGHAHLKGIVHWDIKLENLVITPRAPSRSWTSASPGARRSSRPPAPRATT